MTTLLFLIAVAAGVLFWTAIAGKFEGDRPERSLRIPIGAYYLHVHHWLYCLGAMAALSYAGVSGPFTIGFLAGSTVQGLTYRDWYLLFYAKRRGPELYARWSPLKSSTPQCACDGS
jgi:hypothetical protein